MTVSTSASQATLGGNGSQTTFGFGFTVGLASNLQVILTDGSGNQTVLAPSQYAIALNPPATGQLWGVGGTVTYPLSGPPIASGTTLTISRVVPLTQPTSISNQGSFYPQAVEQAIDTLCMELQQVSARTGRVRGTWAAGIAYNCGDVVVDGGNGFNTGNYYQCAIANTSTSWSGDLAAGDWSLAINVQAINLASASASTSATAAAASAASAASSAASASGSASSASSSAASASASAAGATSAASSAAASAVSAAASATAAALAASALTGTSTTALTVGTGPRTLTTQTGLQIAVGEFVAIANTPAPSNYLHGQVAAYDASTGSLTINVTDTGGSGTFSAWTIAVSGSQGPQGPAGSGGGALSWTTIAANSTMAANTGYLTTGASQVQLTLPPSLTIGQRFEVDGSQGTGGFLVVPNAGQTINWGQTALSGTQGLVGLVGGIASLVVSSSASVDVEYTNVAALFSAGSSQNDPFFNNVTFLLLLNGPSVPTVDSSGNAVAITNTGVSMSSVQTRYGSYSGQFNGSTSYLTTPGSSAINLGTGDFTLEAWVFPTANGGASGTVIIGGGTNGYLSVSAGAYTVGLNGPSGAVCTTVSTLTPNAWNHVAAVRQGGFSQVFINGVSSASAANAGNYGSVAVTVGGVSGIAYFTGYITQVRVTKGVARYTANFSVPVQAFLTAQDINDDPVWNRTVLQLPFENNANDQSGNAIALTNNGATPFSSSVAKIGNYSAGLFNGSNQYFSNGSTTAAEFGTGDFSLEAWVFPTSAGEANGSFIFSGPSGGPYFALNPGAATLAYGLFGSLPTVSTSASLALNSWSHVAAVRSGGTTAIYINGVSAGVAPDANNYAVTGIAIGSPFGAAASSWNGYIDNARVSRFARYTANFTPPVNAYLTALPTAYDPWWQNVTFMLRAAASNSVSDASGNALIVTNGGTTTSGSTTRQDSYSSVFNGTSSNLTVPSPGAATQFAGDFTVEAYVYLTTLSPTAQVFFDTRASGTSSSGFCLLTRNSTGKLGFYYGSSGTDILDSAAVSSATWYHVALVRYAGAITLYLNGIAQGTVSNTVSFSDGNLAVGSQTSAAGGGTYFTGNIAGLRITKAARYTASFTPPTTPFLTNGAT